MSSLSVISTVLAGDEAAYSHVTDLAIWTVGGQDRLYATTRFDGVIRSWDIDGATPAPLDQIAYAGGLAVGRMGLLASIDTGSGLAMLGGGTGNSGLRFYDLAGNGDISAGVGLSGTGGTLGALQDAVTVTLANGNQAIYGALGGRDGLGHLTFNSTGAYLNGRVVQDRTDTYAADVSDLAHLNIGGQDYIYSASATEHGITTWVVAANGILTPGPSLGMDEGLWVAAPTALATARAGGDDFLILGSATSGSLSVIEVLADGSLAVRDHVLDTRDTRFDGVQAVEVVRAQGQTYVISGGSDDGISVHLLIPGGQLVTLESIADTPQASLDNISAITARVTGGDIDIFAASSSEAGITRLTYDTGPAGVTLTANASGQTLTGAAGRDILVGGAGDDRLVGGAGQDVIRDGAGSDTMVGGAGADIFILAYDEAPDVITDFTLGQDRLDLAGWPMVRSKSQLTLTVTETGFRVTYGAEVLEVHSADGTPIDHRDLTEADLIGASRIPQVILPGFPGPYTAPPDLPDLDEFLGISKSGQGNFTYKTLRIDGLRFANPDLGPVNGRVIKGQASRDVIEGGAKRDKLMGERGNDKIIGGKSSDRLFGGGGEDRLYGRNGDDMLAGSKGADQAWGGDGRDWIIGGDGRDRLHGGAQGDLIEGGQRGDRLFGGAGNDRLYAGGGDNRVLGQTGHDRLTAGAGRDMLDGGAGRDVLIGGAGGDTLSGGAGRDQLFGGGGVDTIRGGADRDLIEGGAKGDRLMGGLRADKILGQNGNDRLTGGAGDDLLRGQAGADTVTGDAGADVIYGGGGADILRGGSGADQISGDAGRDTLIGGGGADDLRGAAGQDRLIGAAGDDTLTGGAGDDQLWGDTGADILIGGAGADLLRGGAGADLLRGGAQADDLTGGAGDDTLIGGAGDDTLTGGLGADHFIFEAGDDRITDFTQGTDLLTIAYDAFPGRLTAPELLLLYGTEDSGSVVLDFENGNVLRFDGVSDYTTLSESILVV